MNSNWSYYVQVQQILSITLDTTAHDITLRNKQHSIYLKTRQEENVWT